MFEIIGYISTSVFILILLLKASNSKQRLIRIPVRMLLAVLFIIPAWLLFIYSFAVCRFVLRYEINNPKKAEYFSIRSNKRLKSKEELKELREMEAELNLYPGGIQNKISGLILKAFAFAGQRRSDFVTMSFKEGQIDLIKNLNQLVFAD